MRAAAPAAIGSSRTRGVADMSGRPHDRRLVLAVDEDPLPDLEVQQQPETVAMRRPAAAVVLGEATDGGRIEQAARPRPGAEHEVLHEGPVRAAEPAAHGDGETHLAAAQDLL